MKGYLSTISVNINFTTISPQKLVFCTDVLLSPDEYTPSDPILWGGSSTPRGGGPNTSLPPPPHFYGKPPRGGGGAMMMMAPPPAINPSNFPPIHHPPPSLPIHIPPPPLTARDLVAVSHSNGQHLNNVSQVSSYQ